MNLTKKGQDLLSYIDSLIPENGHLEYNFNDSEQFQFAKMLTEENFNTKRYPGTLKSLYLQKDEHEKNGFTASILETEEGFQNFFGINGLGLDSNTGNIASNGIGTAIGGYSIMSLVLFIKDNKNGNIISHSTKNDIAGTFLPITTPENSGSSNKDVTAYMQYSATPTGGAPISGIIRQNGYNTSADPVITAPVTRTTTPHVPGAINIGLARGWHEQGGTSGFDYAWNEPISSNPEGKIPFVGSVTFNQAIKPLDPNNNFLLQVYVVNETTGGAVTLQSTNLTNVYNSFSIDSSNPNKLIWSLPAGQSTYDPGNPIKFQNITWPSDMKAIFHCSIIVTLEDGTFGSAVVESSTKSDEDPLDGTLLIKPISFIWHCLAEGTQVLMASGEKKLIEDIVEGDLVQTDANGTTARVEWTVKGAHHGGIMKIITADGNSIVTSDSHVFMSGKGPVLALDLKIGETLLSIKGESKITIIEKVLFDGLVFNLATSTLESLKADKISTYIANDFVVGDLNSQKIIRQLNSNDINWVKKQVPEYLHKDVDSIFEDKSLVNKM